MNAPTVDSDGTAFYRVWCAYLDICLRGHIFLDDSQKSVLLSVAFVPTQVLRFALRTERQAIARGWARFLAATATSTASAASAERAKKMAMMEAYVVDLQQQVRHNPAKRGLIKPQKKAMHVDSRFPQNLVSPLAPKSASMRGSLSRLCSLGLISISCSFRVDQILFSPHMYTNPVSLNFV